MIRILLISYYFPPCGAIGSKRWGQMYEILSGFEDIEITVLTANWKRDNDITGVHYVGESINYNPPKSIVNKAAFLSRLKHPSEYFRSLAYETIFGKWRKRALSWINDNSSQSFDLVITSFSPVSVIIIGSHAKKVFKSKLIIDLRDLISLQGQKLKLPLIHWFDMLIDRYLCRHADMMTTIGPTAHKKAEKFYGVPVHILYNGYKDNRDIEPYSTGHHNLINIGYFGTIGYNRSPTTILGLLSIYLNNHSDRKIVLHVASNDDPFKYLKGIELNSRLEIRAYGFLRDSALNDLYDLCDLYLLLEDQTDKGIENLTGKIFDYMSKGKPIMASCNKKSDIAKVLEVSGAGMLVSNEADLLDFFAKFNDGFFYSNCSKSNFFSRECQVENLLYQIRDLMVVKR